MTVSIPPRHPTAMAITHLFPPYIFPTLYRISFIEETRNHKEIRTQVCPTPKAGRSACINTINNLSP